MKRIIEYRYDSWAEPCGCCSDSSSTYSIWEDGKLVEDDAWCQLIESEEELRERFSDKEPFEISQDTQYF